MMPLMGGLPWLWMLAALLIVAGLVVVIGTAFRGSASDADDATRILRARFARGEITADELRTALATLGPNPTRPQAPRRLLIVAVALLIAGILTAWLASAAVRECAGYHPRGHLQDRIGPT